MEISEKEFKKLVKLVESLDSKLESSTKEIGQYSAKLDKAIKKIAILEGIAVELLKGTGAAGR